MSADARLAVATVSEPAARAGVEVGRRGGNAVDAAVAAGLAATVTHPGMCSLGGGGFLTIWPADGDPVTVDGGMEMPGRGLDEDELGRGGLRVELGYAGGVTTVVGAGSVATPGLLAACSLAVERFGRLPWREIVAPVLELARGGFPMPASSHAFLTYAHDVIYGHDPRSRSALHDADGQLLEPGATIEVDGLVGSLETIAREGAAAFYEGEIGARMVEHLRSLGGALTREDLRSYRAVIREPLEANLDTWRVVTAPPPSVGGAVVSALLALTAERPRERWTADAIAHLVRCQRAVVAHRERRLDPSADLAADVRRFLDAAASGDPDRLAREPSRGPQGSSPASRRGPGSTLQASAVDADGTACSATFSDGYGSGVVPPGTGIWLNNCLGEEELNPRGYHGLAPGTRLISNMAPTVARPPGGDRVLALGSPGSERIPVVVHQVLMNRLRLGMSLEEAVQHPRCHVRDGAAGPECVAEPGLPLEEVTLPVHRYPERAMYFGGVAAAEHEVDDDGRAALVAAADTRRSGGTARTDAG